MKLILHRKVIVLVPETFWYFRITFSLNIHVLLKVLITTMYIFLSNWNLYKGF